MKKISILIFIFTAITVVSCKKELTEKPYSVISPNNFYKTKADFETATYGAIGILAGSNLYGYWLHFVTEWPSGDYVNPFTWQVTLSWTTTDLFLPAPWDEHYKLINNCNSILSKIDNVDFDETSKKALKGELFFMRGLAYFGLVRLFGGAPIYLEPTVSVENASKPRSSVKEVYDVIVKDLNDAANLLSVTNPYGVGRATKGSALGLLAKVYVQMAGKPLNDASKWQAALDLLKTMVDVSNPSVAVAPYKYRLESDFQKLFWNVSKTRQGGVGFPTIAAPANENGPEAVYEINYKGVSGYTSAIYPEALANRVCTPWLADKFESSDYRKEVTMVVNGGDPLGVVNLHRKFQSTGDFYNNQDNNWPVVRFADLILLLAEAENEVNGPTPLALSAINAIRARARNANGTPRAVPADYTIADASSKVEMRLLIEKERILELNCEGHGWFDWVRTNRLSAILTEQGRTGYQPTREIFPIPQTQIDISQGVLVQNDGY